MRLVRASVSKLSSEPLMFSLSDSGEAVELDLSGVVKLAGKYETQEELEQEISKLSHHTERRINSAELSLLSPVDSSPAFLDGSAFLNHIRLVRQARGAEMPEEFEHVPLMYQGLSDAFYGTGEEIPLHDKEFGLDCEGEFAVMVRAVPQGVSADQALKYVAFILMLNDWSYRSLIPREVGTGFGFVQSKPANSLAPILVTPDELGDAWKDGRVCLPLTTHVNEQWIGNPRGEAMHFSFGELISHAAKTRHLSAGTIIGSGTVSNSERDRGVSCLAELRMLEAIDNGSSSTPFLTNGDQVTMECFKGGRSLFGKLTNTVKSLS